MLSLMYILHVHVTVLDALPPLLLQLFCSCAVVWGEEYSFYRLCDDEPDDEENQGHPGHQDQEVRKLAQATLK